VDFARAQELDPNDPELWYERPVSVQVAGDLAGYRATCAAMLSRFKDDENPNAANRVAYAYIYGPDPVVDVPPLIRVAERSAPGILGGSRILAAARYRARRFTEALRCFEESHRVFQPRAWDWLLHTASFTSAACLRSPSPASRLPTPNYWGAGGRGWRHLERG
jgi:hypothetical protein